MGLLRVLEIVFRGFCPWRVDYDDKKHEANLAAIHEQAAATLCACGEGPLSGCACTLAEVEMLEERDRGR